MVYIGIIWNTWSSFFFPYLLPSPLKKRPNDCLPDIKSCISYLDEEYIRPICELSGLPGLSYIAGEMDENEPPEVLGIVCYPSNGSTSSDVPDADDLGMLCMDLEYSAWLHS